MGVRVRHIAPDLGISQHQVLAIVSNSSVYATINDVANLHFGLHAMTL